MGTEPIFGGVTLFLFLLFFLFLCPPVVLHVSAVRPEVVVVEVVLRLGDDRGFRVDVYGPLLA